MALTDAFQRPLRDLRISVTDRCNFRCVYCMPKEIFGSEYPYLPHSEVLTFEEIAPKVGRNKAVTVRTIYHRAIEKVRAKMKRHDA